MTGMIRSILPREKSSRAPVQVLWDARRASPIEIWRRWADRVEGIPIDAGHLLAEEAPEAVLAAITPFLQWHGTVGSAVG
jgi:pimeloyl-ACP methyl ester carboxylesterase